MAPSATLDIDLAALQKNARILRRLSGEHFFCPMVKTQSYGHGIVPVTQALDSIGVRQVGVVTVSEARQIRSVLPDTPDILVFGPILNREDLDWLYKNQCVLVANNWRDLEYWTQKNSSRVHIKFNTGFSRLGFAVSEGEKLKEFLTRSSRAKLEGLCSQLLSGEELGDKKSASYGQMEKMKHLRTLFSIRTVHLFNTAALLSCVCHGEKGNFGSRPGIGLYGVKPEITFFSPEAEKKWKGLSLEPASALKSKVVGIHQLEEGEAVSYGGEWRAAKPSVIAVVSLGYGDGFPRALSFPRGQVLFRGCFVPVVGRVCMDFFMVDITAAASPPAVLGEEIVIFGAQKGVYLSPEEQANKAGTISHEFFVRLGGRVERKYL